MPLGQKPQCTICKSYVSLMWLRNEKNEIICCACNIIPEEKSQSSTTSLTNDIINVDNTSNNSNDSFNNRSGKEQVSLSLRKSTRSKSLRAKQQVAQKASVPKGKSRRHIFKKTCFRALAPTASPVPSERLIYQGVYYQIGDVVAMRDEEDGGTYYAQIRGMMGDQYCQKSATVAWLIPSRETPEGEEDIFDPGSYIIGPVEEMPRKLDSMEFVCHAPADYFRSCHSANPTYDVGHESGYVWTSIPPRDNKITPPQIPTSEQQPQ